jgi:putative PEP-CTERM system histidine kinase
MPGMLSTIGMVSHLMAALGFAALGLILALRRRPTGFRLSVALASFVTAFWAASHVYAARFGTPDGSLLNQFETLRTAAWIAVLVVLQRRSWGLHERPSSVFFVAVLLGFVIALQIALPLLFDVGGMAAPTAAHSSAAQLFVTTRLVVAISGLVLLHNLYINSKQTEGWSFRLFAVGLGVIFAYDLNLYTLQFLLGEANPGLVEIRGAVNALAVPLLFLSFRTDGEMGRFQLSHQAAFHTVSFSMIGLYLIVMSLLAYGLKMTGGNWGELLQVTFLSITIIVGALVMLSPRFRAELKVRIARNFYRYRYDYRVEWLRFIETIDVPRSQGGQGARQPIRERLIEAVAAVLDCPGGALLEPADDGGFEATARWRWKTLDVPRIGEGSAFTLFLKDSFRIVDFDSLRREAGQLGMRGGDGGSHGSLTLPEWALADQSIWLAVPLSHRETLTGILILQRSLAPRDLNWEDYDLLRTLGRQGASYLAEAETQARLDEARTFDEFNRRFAFVMHDLKNVVSQLGLVARNAERHADKPEFRADMVATLNSSVTKMTDLMALLGRASDGQQAHPAEPEGEVDLARVATIVTAAIRRQHPAIELEGAEASLFVAGDADRLEAMLTHLLQNAVDASAPDALVRLTIEPQANRVQIVIADRGHGMSKAFIREELFKPFRSTKDGGFGIGAFEAREIARVHGGRLQVSSKPGEGSSFTITLPLPARAAVQRESA